MELQETIRLPFSLKRVSSPMERKVELRLYWPIDHFLAYHPEVAPMKKKALHFAAFVEVDRADQKHDVSAYC